MILFEHPTPTKVDIDWNELAKSAPPGFGMLQLFNSNADSMRSSFDQYVTSKYRKLWHERFPRQPAAFWSTCAYLINKNIMKSVIDKLLTFKRIQKDTTVQSTQQVNVTVLDHRNIVQQQLFHQYSEALNATAHSNTTIYIAEVKLIAGQRWECVPANSPCCPNPSHYNYTYSEMVPCVLSPRGFQADMFLYATTKAFVLNVPLIANGVGGNQSKC